MGRENKIVLVSPTLDLERAARTLAEARQAAGVPCGVLIASDQEKRGAVVANNVLIRAAIDWGAQFIGYVNDDCWGFPDGWLKRLVGAVSSSPDYGIAVAGAPCRSSPQKDGGPGLEPAIVEVKRPCAWVVAVIKTLMFERFGFLDENLIHYADDSDFEMRMRKGGFKSVYVQDVWVNHETGDGHWIMDWYEKDKAYFKRRWGRV